MTTTIRFKEICLGT